MTLRLSLRPLARVIQHFTCARALEVLVLQASPLLGAVLAGAVSEWIDLSRLALLLTGSVALTAHVFVFNDWAGQSSDINDPRRMTRVFGRRGCTSRQVGGLTVALLVAATAALAFIGARAVLLGAAIAALSLLYSCSPFFGKGTPIIASLVHLLGGALHFLLGYTLVRPVDARGVAIAIFFGLVFTGGHLNQEVRDYEGDLRNRIRTNAVVFGCRRTFLASLVVFTGSYAMIVGLAALAVLPRPLVFGAFLWPMHLVWSLKALQSDLSFDVARWMQRRYRVLFAVLGLAMLVTAVPMTALAGQGQASKYVHWRATCQSLDPVPPEVSAGLAAAKVSR